ncbi:MlaE family lipid ABC transporter permease subunit [Pseudomonas sp. NPDC090202]|uniref:ABC transporter permease n=1 Tax=unclassified Pseudomonas TaxID=196821 RepID=UPI00380D462E
MTSSTTLTLSTAKACGSVSLDTSANPAQLWIAGDWTLAHYRELRRQTDALKASFGPAAQVDMSGLGALDTAGASLLVELLGVQRLRLLAVQAPNLPESSRALMQTIQSALCDYCQPVKEPEATVSMQLLARIGAAVDVYIKDTLQLLGFVGLILQTLVTTLFRPRRWRLTSTIAHIEQIGLDAAPIVALLTFMVGAVVAFLGATVLKAFGATIFTVDLIGFSFLREFAVLLTAILLAGRTASAFTAQIGSMKANEELDALQTLGLSPTEMLVLPRVLALLISLPILTFLAMICGIAGGGVVCALSLGISPAMFLSLMQADIGVQHFLVGIVKAPIFAFFIASIGCLEGFKVEGSAESVGAHTTSSVVQSIFVVIVLDALAAMFFMEIGW